MESPATVQFKPTSPALTSRYDTKAKADRPTRAHRYIEPGFAPKEALSLPSQWSSYVHPEGSRYFVYDSTPRIVTDHYMATNPEYDEFTTQYANAFLHLFKKSDIPHVNEIEIYIRKDPISGGGLYYLVDHAHQRISWLESVNTAEMGLLAPSSDSHLELVLQIPYWTHVSYFPSHLHNAVEKFDPRREELRNLLSASRVDYITSATACVPYRSEQCKELGDSLKNIQVNAPYEIWVVARLWSLIAQERVLNGFGEEDARIDSEQLIYNEKVGQRGRTYELLSMFLFRLPDVYAETLENKLWRDAVVNSVTWNQFWSNLQWEWKMCLAVSSVLLITNILATNLFGGRSVYATSLIFAFGGVGSSLVLMLLRYQYVVASGTAEDAFSTLSGHKDNGFSLLAIAFSLPRSLTYWALVMTAFQIVVTCVTLGDWMAWLTNLTAVLCIVCFYEVFHFYCSRLRGVASSSGIALVPEIASV